MTPPTDVLTTNPAIPQGFDKILHLRYRLHLPTLLGVPVLAVYDFLHSQVWRESLYGPEDLLKGLRDGKLCAQTSQRQIAEMFGISRETVNRYMRKLYRLGWISSDTPQASGGVKLYVLGKVPDDTLGAYVEENFANTAMQAWYLAAEELATRRYKQTYKQLPVTLQRTLIQELMLNTCEGVTAKQDRVRRGKGGVIRRLKKNLGTDAEAAHAQVLERSFDALGAEIYAASSAEGGVTGGCDRSDTGTPTEGDVTGASTPESDQRLPVGAKIIPLYPAQTGGEGVIVESQGVVTYQSHLTSTNRRPEVSEISGDFSQKHPTFSAYIYSSNRYSFDSLRSLRTTYSDSFKNLQSLGAYAPLYDWEPRVPPAGSLYADDRLPPAQALTPVPPPPFPVASVTVAEAWVTPPCQPALESGYPKEALPVTAKRLNPSRTSPESSEGEIAPPRPPSVDLESKQADLTGLIEQAKARSRAAMEAKVQKKRAKEQKAANLTSDKSYRGQKLAAQKLEQVWRDEMAAAFPGLPQIAWFKYERGKTLARKEGKLAADLIEGYGGDLSVCEDIVQTFIRHWSVFGPMLTKQDSGIPTFGLLYACHATVVAEGVRLKQKDDVITRYENWRRDNAGNDFAIAPAGLEAAYKEALAKRGKK